MLKKITLCVICFHLVALIGLFFSPVKKSKLPPQKFVVQTQSFKQAPASYNSQVARKISQSPPTPQKPPKKKPVPKQKPPTHKPPKQKPIPEQKSPKEKAPEHKKPELKPPPERRVPPTKPIPTQSKQVEPPNFQNKIVKELEEIIAKIEERNVIMPAPSSLQEIIGGVQDKDIIFAEHPEESYQNALLTYLHEALHLPEHGEVKMQLTIKEDGSLAKIVVLKAESVKNRGYLEKQLPLLRFPYPQDLPGKEKTFVLTFCNEPKS